MHGGAAGQMGYPGKMGSHPNMMNNPAMGSQPYNNQYPNQGEKINSYQKCARFRQENRIHVFLMHVLDVYKNYSSVISDQMINNL